MASVDVDAVAVAAMADETQTPGVESIPEVKDSLEVSKNEEEKEEVESTTSLKDNGEITMHEANVDNVVVAAIADETEREAETPEVESTPEVKDSLDVSKNASEKEIVESATSLKDNGEITSHEANLDAVAVASITDETDTPEVESTPEMKDLVELSKNEAEKEEVESTTPLKDSGEITLHEASVDALAVDAMAEETETPAAESIFEMKDALEVQQSGGEKEEVESTTSLNDIGEISLHEGDVTFVEDTRTEPEPKLSVNGVLSPASAPKAHERLYAKGTAKNTTVRLAEKEKKKEEKTPLKSTSRVSLIAKSPNDLYERSFQTKEKIEKLRKELEEANKPTFKPELVTKSKITTDSTGGSENKKKREKTPPESVRKVTVYVKSPNDLYERSFQKKEKIEKLRKDLEEASKPTFKPELVTKSKNTTDSTCSSQPAWERLHKQGEVKKALAAQRAAQKAEEEAATLKKPSSAVKKLQAGEVPRWQQLYEQGSQKQVNAKPTATSPPRPKTSASVVASGSRLDQLYNQGKDSNRRRSVQHRDHRIASRTRMEDEQLAEHCTFRPTLTSPGRKKHADGGGSVASSTAGIDSLIGKSLEVDLSAGDMIAEDAKIAMDLITSATVDSSQPSIDEGKINVEVEARDSLDIGTEENVQES